MKILKNTASLDGEKTHKLFYNSKTHELIEIEKSHKKEKPFHLILNELTFKGTIKLVYFIDIQ